MVKGIIFDLDGTIWNSIDYRVEAWKRAFKDYNIDSDPEVIKLMIGYPGSMLIKKMNAVNPEIEMREEKYFYENIGNVRFFSDVEDTFSILKSNNIKIAVVTSSRRKLIDKLNLSVDAIITMDDVKNGKPSTEPYLKAINLMGIKPEDTVVVGDIDNDLIPAKNLHCISVLVTHGNKKESDHKDYEIENIKEIIQIMKNIKWI